MQTNLIDFRAPTSFRPVNTFSHLRLAQPESLAQVLDALAELRRAQPDFRFLCTLDDLGQCCYTSMHASHDKRIMLHDTDIDFDDSEAVHAGEARELVHVMGQLDRPELQQAWTDVSGTLCTMAKDIDALVAMNETPDDVLDEVVYVQRLPVPRDDLAIAGLPNGYFNSDWNVFQNHGVIRHLAARYGYRFFGIGASWLGFERAAPPEAALAGELTAELAALYAPEGDAAQSWGALEALLPSRRTLLLGYTENFAE